MIQEAAKIGLYGFEALAQFWADATGLTLPIVNEELFWGDAGIGMAIMGTTLAVAAIFGQGTPEQIGEWIPQCFGTPDDVKVAAFCASEPDAGSDVSAIRTTRQVRRGQGRVGAQRPEGLGDQRRHRRRPRRDRLGRPRARLARPRRLRHPARAPRAASRAPRSRSTACAPRTPPTSTSTTAASPAPACSAARRSSTSAWPASARARSSKSQAAMQTFEASRPDGRRPGARHRPRRLRVRARLRQGARAVRPPDHREPGDRLHARRHEDWRSTPPGCWSGAPPGWAAPARRSRTPRARCRS